MGFPEGGPSHEEMGSGEFSVELNEQELAADKQLLDAVKRFHEAKSKASRFDIKRYQKPTEITAEDEQARVKAQDEAEKLGQELYELAKKDCSTGNTEIIVAYDRGYDDFVVYFPQIEPGEEASAQGVYDQLMRVGVSQTLANRLGERAKLLAEQGKSLFDIYKEIDQLSAGVYNSEQLEALEDYKSHR